MAVIYVKEQGSTIQKVGERIVVTKNQNRLLDMPAFQIENIAVIGNVQITTQALHMLMEKGVDVSYLTYSGKFLGNTSAEASKNIFLRFEQYQFYLNETRRLGMARIIVRNKIQNQIEIIREHRRKNPEYDWDTDIKQMVLLQNSLHEKVTPNEILGVEGMCSNIYFRSFSHMLDCDFEFNGRNRRPPKDPINVIISLAYTLLTKEVASALDSESFEPYLGFLHGIRYGRKSLSLDMVEEFRQPVVDRLVILLFNKRMLGKYDFEIPEEGRVVLTEDGFKKFCNEYERWITGKNSLSGEKNFRAVIREQIAELKRSIRNGKEYSPYAWRDRSVRDQL
ncbi:MAG: CRISPR-associated endonuclease Cas1 [Butyrivibrio sp.]|nr:CRISPR-associated endonuclease Cas1 [Butyrivibrio sp.]